MTGDDFLETLQADVLAILKAVPSLADVNVIKEDDGDMDSKILRMLGTVTEGGTAKKGCVAVVMLPEVTDAEANLPGPPLNVELKVQVIEQHVINRATASGGSGVRSSEGALRVLAALHHQVIGPVALYAGKKPVEPVEVKKGFLSHMVSLRCDHRALQGPGKVLGVSAEVTEGGGIPDTLTITGITDPAGRDPLVLTRTDDISGSAAWAVDDVLAFFVAGEWAIHINFGTEYLATVTSAAATPVGLTGWALTAGAGQPSIAGSGGSSTLTLTCATSGASIYYTLDGSYPDATNGTLYAAPIAMPEAGTLVRAAAYKTALNPSDCLELDIT